MRRKRQDKRMKTIDRDGLLLCELQAKTFELSVDTVAASSAIFVRRFMNSKTAKWLDSGTILASNMQPADLLALVEEQYGPSGYGSEKYTYNEMYWMGYVYRYYAYTYQCSSVSVYKTIKPKELRGVFLPYHTLDPSQAIERILEAKGISENRELDIMHQYEVFRRIREA
jgi:hypothetical protein